KGKKSQPKKESVIHTRKHEHDGVVHHALAFNTLLSSQETDAYSPTCERRSFRLRCVFIFSAARPGVKLTRLASTFWNKHRPVSGTTPLTYQPIRMVRTIWMNQEKVGCAGHRPEFREPLRRPA
ncbi:hypothetical protein, partial [Nonomuraea sp. NEAU-A123]|uniref:hypothetical protein n=1 Tax=Nonomuraea sp. NEAU-A123 TaxID=2839649 RepID=UPI001BE4519F